jgi:cytochrome c-type biogenesis protein CcmH/NrfG
LGNTLKELGRLKEAEVSYKKALSIDPTRKKTLVGYGNLLLKFNKHLDGLKFIDEGQGVIVFTESSFKII